MMKQMHHKERERVEREREREKEKERERDRLKELEAKPVIKQEVLDVSVMGCESRRLRPLLRRNLHFEPYLFSVL